ncbi:Asp-tRNA(Asn)/Glu-tRNA(Gln) amidotransferase subunit GatA [Luoshenia tenuis]|jgi:aspartyl-tRNA(Asn)/glutamyl-tRNA(Gln) amidotransferase subunit A|uniref:Asp-tRNA(Asn)/Glu-tRNA(Gln) amidotransferase subunit GatA n=1 Tax=Luoshenia tenuis TaxID=2763654 RepID=UPI003D8DF3C3
MKVERIIDWSAAALAEKLAAGQVSAQEAAKAYLEQIEARETQIGAYIQVTREEALAQAAQVDARRAAGEQLHPLAGVPMALKDNLCTKGIKTTCGSKMLQNFRPPYTATAAQRLEQAGCVLLGKANMDEFAMGSSTENSYYQPTRNPVDPTRVPGGSSGGSAAAVGAREAAFALGSDTGGSIRQPAAFCGVVGMKPTYGAVSRYGLVAFASSLDQIGPLTRDVRDSALVLSAIAGHDPRDSTSLKRTYGDFGAQLGEDVAGMRLGLPREFLEEGIDPQVKEAVLAAARRYEKLGARVEPVSLPTLKRALPAYYVISSAEASSNLARFDGVRYGYRAKDYADMDELYERTRSEGFGPEVKRRIMLGTFALSAGYYEAFYNKALQVRTLVVREFEALFKDFDALLSPVAPTTAYRLGEKMADPMEMYLGDIYTVPVNIAGLPALSLPCGRDQENLPIGMQLIGPPFSEQRLYQLGYAFEQDDAKEAEKHA